VNRFLAVLLFAALSCGALAADKAAKPRASKASGRRRRDHRGRAQPAIDRALVLDPATGQTLYSKNADHVAPIASITKLMTAMVVIDANLAMDEPIQITTDDIDTIKATHSRLPIGAHFRRDDLMRLALMASDNRAASALAATSPAGCRSSSRR